VDPAKALERFLDRPRVAYVRDVLDTYGQAPGGLLANGLAFAALFATIPTMLVALGMVGLLVDDPQVQAKLAGLLKDAFPPLSELIDGAIDALSTGAALTSIVGVVGLVWTVSQLYVTLDVAFARMFRAQTERDIVVRTARGFAWVAVLLAGIIVLIVAVSVAAAMNALVPDAFALGSLLESIVTSPPALIAVAIVVLVIVYRVLPPVAPSLSAIWLPAVIAGTAIILLSQLFAFLAPRLVGVAALAGSLATAFIALAWLSFTFQILLYGAAWVRVREGRGRPDGSVEGPGDAATSGLAGPAPPAEPGVGGE
jgi:YihY family inner membrane protein